ncbi:MAG: hypothetical protein GY858_07205 [Candidatus Omnitrophica bacterium]|nr:hypothetical protein [Candidatus Omnitrophota bacterium]
MNSVLRIKNYKKIKAKKDKKQLIGSSFASLSGFRICSIYGRKSTSVLAKAAR